MGTTLRWLVAAVLLAAAAAEDIGAEADFDAALSSGKSVFVKMYAPWCGHCKRLAPAWDQLTEQYAGDDRVIIGDVDCTSSGKAVCSQHGVRGFPTILYFRPGSREGTKYNSGRSYEALDKFVRQTLLSASPSQQGQQQEGGDPIVVCETTAGEITIETHRDWAPIGHARFMELVRAGFFTDQIIYRVIPRFIAQFGVAADPAVHQEWSSRPIDDDPPKPGLFKKGAVSFAGSGPRSRSTHIFVADSPRGERLGKAHHERPFGIITKGVDEFFAGLFSGYGDLTSMQLDLVQDGNKAAKSYPKLSRVHRCYVAGEGSPSTPQPTPKPGSFEQGGGASAPGQRLAGIAQQLADLRKRKAEATAADDLELALQLKKQIQALEKDEEKLKKADAAGGARAAELQKQIESLQGAKRIALEKDDLEAAVSLKKQIKELEHELKSLSPSPAAEPEAASEAPARAQPPHPEGVPRCKWRKFPGKSALPSDEYYSKWMPTADMERMGLIFSTDGGESCKPDCEREPNCAGFVWRRDGRGKRTKHRCFFLGQFGGAHTESEPFDSYQCEREQAEGAE